MISSVFPTAESSRSLHLEGGLSLLRGLNMTRGQRLSLGLGTADPVAQENEGANLLIVEDNDVLRDGIRLILEADGFKVFTAAHGLEALELMRTTYPDLILSDIAMPRMDGYEFFQAVRSRSEWVTIPFIFLTARGGREEIVEGKKLGAEDYLVKPVNRQELIATIRSRLARSQQLLLVQLQQAYEASLIMLANAIEMRDLYTRGHVERVREYALAISRQMDFPTSQLNALQLGGILHDIGKIHIRESILSKSGPLNDDEWAEMKRHPAIGAELIKNIPYLTPAILVIHHHHERWDGKGYPDGLAGEEIPLAARIVAVADSLDAMVSTRVYHAPCSSAQAYTEIQMGSGNRYDPGVVQAFERAWEEILGHMK